MVKQELAESNPNPHATRVCGAMLHLKFHCNAQK
jgi:hypothetical protein